ncbi:MAG: response regulator [Desulfatiglans sp.]|nr:response regulator [Desulfatiglans sp.]
MRNKSIILIADRNPHVRDFLTREMTKEGYSIRSARNGREVLNWISHQGLIDLLIIDPDLPDVGPIDLMTKVHEQVPSLPVVVHSFLSDFNNHLETLQAAAYVEKEGDSIDRLKEVVTELLEKLSENFHPSKFNRKKETTPLS